MVDLPCPLTKAQRALAAELGCTNFLIDVDGSAEEDGTASVTASVSGLESLSIMRLLCVHPALALPVEDARRVVWLKEGEFKGHPPLTTRRSPPAAHFPPLTSRRSLPAIRHLLPSQRRNRHPPVKHKVVSQENCWC